MTYRNSSIVCHTLDSNLVVQLGLQGRSNGGSNNRAHVTHFSATTSKDEGQGLAAVILSDSILSDRSSQPSQLTTEQAAEIRETRVG